MGGWVWWVCVRGVDVGVDMFTLECVQTKPARFTYLIFISYVMYKKHVGSC